MPIIQKSGSQQGEIRETEMGALVLRSFGAKLPMFPDTDIYRRIERPI